MTEKPIGLALVGCGQIADAHLRAIAKIDTAVLIRTVDNLPERAQQAAERYGATHGSSDLDQALGDDAVDAVILCLPHEIHCDITLKAAAAGKHILVEKPLALDEAEGRRMVEAADAAGVQLSVGQSTRCMDTYHRAKELVQQGTLGKILQVAHQRFFWVERLSTPWRQKSATCGGLYLPLFGSHDIDAMLWLLEDTPQRVWGAVRANSQLSDGDTDGFIGLEFADGKLGSVSFAVRSRRRREEMILIGDQATLSIRRDRLLLDDQEQQLPEKQDSFERQLRLFTQALVQGDPVPVQGSEILPVLRTLDLVKQATTSGATQEF
jgi:predicted dehydrogenase